MSWAPRIRSSDFDAVADDAAKDDENVAFLDALPLAQQAEWLARLGWLRLADRLSENQIVEPHARRFEIFHAEWRRAFDPDAAIPREYAGVWREMRASLHEEPRALAAWDDYLDALSDYTRANLEIPTLEEHDRMLRRLTGNVFAVFPYLRDSQREAAVRFGALDQMTNNVRDLAEDAARGLCFFPSDVLARFELSRASLLHGSAIGTPGYRAMMRFWLDEHLADVRRDADEFTAMSDLHPSLARMRETCLARHAKIERVLRDCDLNYREFPDVYWRSSSRRERQAAG
jgi:phytoene synthase